MNETLVTENINLVPFTVKKYFQPQNNDIDDFCAIGNIGLVRAAKSFDPTKQAAFTTYAVTCIFNEVSREITAKSREKRTAVEGFVYLDETYGGEGEKDGSIHEVIPFEDTSFTDIENKILVEHLLSLLKNEREKQLLVLHFGLYGVKEMTCTEIGKRMGCTGTRVSQIIRKSLEHIRRMAGQHLDIA